MIAANKTKVTAPGVGGSGFHPRAQAARATAVVALLMLHIPVAAVAQQVFFSKQFSPATIGPGSTSRLAFHITNDDTVLPVTGLSFSDSLPAGVVISPFPNVSSDCGGSVSAPAGGSTISFSGGQLTRDTTCTIGVDVTSAVPGTHMNVTGDLTSSDSNYGSAAADLHVVGTWPSFFKLFSPSSVQYGERTTLVFTIDNTGNPSAVESVEFRDELPPGLVIASPSNATTDCGTAPLTADLVAVPGTGLVSYLYLGIPSFEAVAAGSFCFVSVDVVPTAVGTLGNASSDLQADFVPVGKANNTLQVSANPVALVKEFLFNPVTPSETTVLRFKLLNLSREAVTDISFTDDIGTLLPGAQFFGLPVNNACGPGSSLVDNAGVLTFTGGSLPVDGICFLHVNVHVPNSASPGKYINKASTVSATVGGVPLVGAPPPAYGALDVLHVSLAPRTTKQFVPETVGAGGSVTLSFHLQNASTTHAATNITFNDILDPVFSPAGAMPMLDICGAGSGLSIDLNNVLRFFGGSLPASEACSFDLELDVSQLAPRGTLVNRTTGTMAVVDGTTWSGADSPPASVNIIGAPRLHKHFLNNPVSAPEPAVLEFTISNDGNGSLDQDAYDNFTDITFADDLAFYTGLAALSVPEPGFCGDGSELGGVTLLTLTNASLAPGTRCTFEVDLLLPPGGPPGIYTNVSDVLEAYATGQDVGVIGPPTVDDLEIAGLQLQMEFIDDPALPGGTVTVEYSITNTHPVLEATEVIFEHDLDDLFEGIIPLGLPLIDVCGGTSLVNVFGGASIGTFIASLGVGESCTFQVVLQLPPGAPPGTHPSATSEVEANMDDLEVRFSGANDTLQVGDGEEVEVTVNKAYEGGAQGPEVLVSLSCPGAAIAENGGVDVPTVGGVATFTVSGFGEGVTCTATETVPDGYYLLGDDCGSLQVVAGSEVGPECTLTNAQNVSVLVNKAYVGTASGPEVLVTLECPGANVAPNGGVDVATSGGQAEFTVTDIPAEGVTCSAFETVPDGFYLLASDCSAMPVMPSDDPGPECTITNGTPATVSVYKEYVAATEKPEVLIDLSCPGATVVENGGVGVSTVDLVVQFTVTDIPQGGVSCTATETVPDGFLLFDTSCEGIDVLPGSDESCTITNVRDFEKIPVLTRTGLMVLTLMLLAAGVAWSRRRV